MANGHWLRSRRCWWWWWGRCWWLQRSRPRLTWLPATRKRKRSERACFLASWLYLTDFSFLKKDLFTFDTVFLTVRFFISIHRRTCLGPFQLLEYHMWWKGGCIWYSREIGLCPPRTRAHPVCGVGSRFCGGWGEGGGRRELPPPTHRKSGIDPAFAVGGGREEGAPSSHPP